MLAGLEHTHGIHEPVAALLGNDEGQVLVILQHGQIVAGVVHGDGRVAALHLAEDLVHDEGLIHTLVFGILHQLKGLGQLSLIGGVDVVAQIAQGGHQRIAGVVDHQHLPCVLLVEHSAPAGDGLVHHSRVVDDAHAAPGVGYGVLVLRVKAQVGKLGVHQLKIGDGGVVQLRQHILLDQPGDHIVGGYDHIEVRAAHLDKGVQRLVALGGLVVHTDAGLLLEFGDQGLIDILAPGAHIDHALAAGRGTGDDQYRQQHTGHSACGDLLAQSGIFLRRRSERSALVMDIAVMLGMVLPQVDDGQQDDDRDEQQRGYGVDLRADALFGHAVDGHGQRGGGRTRREVADDEIINGHSESRQCTGDDTGLDLRNDDLPEGLHPGAAQVLGRIDQIAVHLP